MKQETIDRIRKFTEDREWEQFHSPANLAKSIVIEAAELLECFQWNDKEYDLQHVKEELADVMVYSQNLLDAFCFLHWIFCLIHCHLHIDNFIRVQSKGIQQILGIHHHICQFLFYMLQIILLIIPLKTL